MPKCSQCGSEDRAQTLWSDMRGLVEHEDSLVNNRLRWFFTFNGFLFAALGLSINAQANLLVRGCDAIECQKMHDLIDGLRATIFVAGIVSSVFALFGVVIAQSAVRAAQSDYLKACEDKGIEKSVFAPVSRVRTDKSFVDVANGFPSLMAAVWVSYAVWSVWVHVGTAIVVGLGVFFVMAVTTYLASQKADFRNSVVYETSR